MPNAKQLPIRACRIPKPPHNRSGSRLPDEAYDSFLGERKMPPFASPGIARKYGVGGYRRPEIFQGLFSSA